MTDNTHRQAIAQLLTSFSGQQNTLTIPRPYITLCDGDILAALLLSQCIYWADRTKDKEGWFAKSYAEWFYEIGMTQYQVSRAVKLLKRFGLETKLKKFDGAPTVHYRVKMDVFSKSIMKKLDNPLSSNFIIHDEETSQSLTKPTTKNTSKPTAKEGTRAQSAQPLTTPSEESVSTPLPPSMANAVDDAAAQSYQPIDNHTVAMAQADVYIRAFEGACKAWNAPQTIPRTRQNRRIAAQWYVDGYTADEIRTAVNDTFDAGKQVSFAFFGEKLSLLRNKSRPASVTARPLPRAAPSVQPAAASFSGGVAELKRQAAEKAKRGA